MSLVKFVDTGNAPVWVESEYVAALYADTDRRDVTVVVLVNGPVVVKGSPDGTAATLMRACGEDPNESEKVAYERKLAERMRMRRKP